MTLLDRTAALFRANPGVWLRAERLQEVGGRFASRTRISDCRTKLGMVIENRQYRAQNTSGKFVYIISEYRYIPPMPHTIERESDGPEQRT